MRTAPEAAAPPSLRTQLLTRDHRRLLYVILTSAALHPRHFKYAQHPSALSLPRPVSDRHRETFNLAGNKRRSFSGQAGGGLLNRMFGSKEDEAASIDDPAVQICSSIRASRRDRCWWS
jgi:hypothetical protein